MRFREISVNRYNIFRDRKWEFAPGLQVIYGPNEAGKSTLLQLVREVLFGFPHRHRYKDFSGEMTASAILDFSDGRSVAFTRRKGNQRVVVGTDDHSEAPVDSARLSDLLGAASSDVYQRVFAFALEELSQGEKSFDDAQLRDALFGATLGGLSRFRAPAAKTG